MTFLPLLHAFFHGFTTGGRLNLKQLRVCLVMVRTGHRQDSRVFDGDDWYEPLRFPLNITLVPQAS